MTRTFALAFALFAALALPRSAALAAEAPTAAVKAANERVRQALDAYSKAEGVDRKAAREGVRKAVETLLDFDALVKDAAGAHWEGLHAHQRHQFTQALRGVMQANYLSKMNEQGKVDVSKINSEYVGEEPQDGGKVKVKTVLHSGDDSARVDYLLEHGKHGWRAVDVITEDTSLVDTYKEQINSLWPKGGFAKVVARLEKKRKALEAKEEAPAAAKE